MKNKFKGWRTVFQFTFNQSAKTTGYRVVTALVSLLIVALIILLNIVAAKPSKKEQDTQVPSPIQSVIVLDQSGLEPTDYRAINPAFSDIRFGHVEFIPSVSDTKEGAIREALVRSPETILITISIVEEGYLVDASIPEHGSMKMSDVEELIPLIVDAFNANKMMQSGLSTDQLTAALKPTFSNYSKAGEETNEFVFVINMIAPMLFGLILYMMLLFYGQNVSKSISTEKTSKLMESLLTSVHPYALISGKVLAVTSMALLQFAIWIVSIIAGLYGGNLIAKSIYPDYQNSIISMINFIRDNLGEAALSIPNLILAFAIFVCGFLFYSFLAGLAGSLVSKPEDVSTSQALFTIPVVVSFLVCYLAPVYNNDVLIKATRYIPFTIPFGTPSALITGTLSLGQGLISFGILALFSFWVIILSARLYKGMVLYTGQKFQWKLIGAILKAKN